MNTDFALSRSWEHAVVTGGAASPLGRAFTVCRRPSNGTGSRSRTSGSA